MASHSGNIKTLREIADDLAAERKKLLEKESAGLEKQADRLADEIKELSGHAIPRFRPW